MASSAVRICQRDGEDELAAGSAANAQESRSAGARQIRLDQLSDGGIRGGVDRPRVQAFDDAFPTDDLQGGLPLGGVRPAQRLERMKRLRRRYPRFGDGGAMPHIRGEPVAEAHRRAAGMVQETAIDLGA